MGIDSQAAAVSRRIE